MTVQQIKKFLFASLSLFASSLFGTETQPWLGNPYEFEQRSSLMFQHFPRISSGSHHPKYSSNGYFLNLSLANSLPSYGLEAEIIGARTRRQKGTIDQIKLTGRYVLEDDIAADQISLIAGISFIQSFRQAVHDISSFHHGLTEGELFVSAGKENPKEIYWNSRYWGLLGIGSSFNQGSAWIRFNLNYERLFLEKHEFRIFMNTLWGLGHKELHRTHFHGYGSVQHQSIDLGLRYTFLIEYFGSASFEYSYRPYARNFPMQTHRILLQYLHTFGL